MSVSNHDDTTSECSNIGSPQSYTTTTTGGSQSPYSSSSQLVPQLTSDLIELSCRDNGNHYFNISGIKPFLRVIEQPQNHFRFRYVSEMVGTHGCLLGKSYTNNKTKTHPTVELVNFNGRAVIRCRLAQHDKAEEHPHKLLEDEQDREVSQVVPEHGSYKVVFPGMGIIHTAKKDVPALLFKKFSEQSQHTNINAKELRASCDAIAKKLNLNIVRLMFTAHDMETGKDICDPVFTEHIHNMKSAATNDLKICRISRYSGRPRGGDDVFIFVEKVNKKNIKIRFFELDDNGDECWEAYANFLQSDVHHQYGIVFRTPAYRNPVSPVDVKVYVQLVRPTDERTSEPKQFTFKAEQIYKAQNKRRKANSSYSSIESSSGGSIKSMHDVPVTVMEAHNVMDIDTEIPMYSALAPAISAGAQCNLASALNMCPTASGPMWAGPETGPAATSLPELQLNSTDLQINSTDLQQMGVYIDPEYFDLLSDVHHSSTKDLKRDGMNGMGFIKASLVADSGRISNDRKKQVTPSSPIKSTNEMETSDVKSEYGGYYKVEDSIEVKKLVKEICEIIRKKGYNTQDVRSRLERLFNIRLSNGDTFLHMTLCSNQPSFEYIVRIIHSVKMSHLLELYNDRQQTALHRAVAHDLPRLAALLVAKGCNPMFKDIEEENAIHYAMKRTSCLRPLLDAIKKRDVPYDLNDYNSEKHTPLHLAVIYDGADDARVLLRHGASYSARDAEGRAPLHLAADRDYLDVMRALLEGTAPDDVDAVDGRGNTALQIVCGSTQRANSVAMVKLLLEHKADPMKHEDCNESAWRLARGRPALREALRPAVPAPEPDDDVKSEPEDEYESADEGEDEPEWGNWSGVARLLDGGAAWRALCAELGVGSLESWFANQPSPTHTMFQHLKESGMMISSEALASSLDKLGQSAAASLVRASS